MVNKKEESASSQEKQGDPRPQPLVVDRPGPSEQSQSTFHQSAQMKEGPVLPSTADADRRQAMQAHRMTDEERRQANEESIAARKKMSEEHAKAAHEQQAELAKSMVDKMFLRDVPVNVVRPAQPDDLDYHPTEARTVVRLPDGVERVVRDIDITASPVTDVPQVYGVGSAPRDRHRQPDRYPIDDPNRA